MTPHPPSRESVPAVRVGVSASCFSHLAPGGLRLGARLLARHVSVELGRPAELQICDTRESLVRVMIERDLEVVMLPAEWFVEGGQGGPGLVACVMSGSVSGPETSWVLLTRGAARCVPPAGGTVLVADGGRGRLASLWLRAIGRGMAGASDDRLFREVIEPRPELAVLRVFLGKADGCVVPESDFLAACADNPQLADRLGRVASSPPLPGAVVCLRTSQSKPLPDQLQAALARLTVSPQGRALATLLQTGNFSRFDPALVPALESLVEGGAGLPGRPDGVSEASSSAVPPPPR